MPHQSVLARLDAAMPAGLLLVVCFAFTTAGCSESKKPYTTAPVTGKVTYDDGSLIPIPVNVVFVPQVEALSVKEPPSRAMGAVDPATGEFTLTTFKEGDGAILGMSKVLILPSEEWTDDVPEACTRPDITPLSQEVVKGENRVEIKVPKP